VPKYEMSYSYYFQREYLFLTFKVPMKKSTCIFQDFSDGIPIFDYFFPDAIKTTLVIGT
jgi:hypothetical protein